MEPLALLLTVIGTIGGCFASIWFLVVAFRKSVLWGLFCLILPIVCFFFLIVHWPDAKRPFLWSLLFGLVTFVGAMMGGFRGAHGYMVSY